MINSVCVFLGSNPGNSDIYRQTAQELGRDLVQRKVTVVYGGSGVGLMGVLADTVMQHGGKITGVMPKGLVDKEIHHPGLDDLRYVTDMHERKALMAELSDAFIAMPGGMGTLEETCEILTWGQLGFHTKPCGLLNIQGYYDSFLAFLDNTVREGFLMQDHRDMILTAQTGGELLDLFAAYTPPEVEKWIERKKTLARAAKSA